MEILNFLNDRRYVKPTLKVVKWNIKDNPDKGEDRILKIKCAACGAKHTVKTKI